METALQDYIKTIAAFYAVREGKGYLVFMSGERRMRVELGRVTHVSGAEEGSMIHTAAKGYPTSYHLNDIARELPPHLFMRVHPLHIVALAHTRGLEGKEVLVAGTRLYTTRFYRQQLSEALERRRKSRER